MRRLASVAFLAATLAPSTSPACGASAGGSATGAACSLGDRTRTDGMRIGATYFFTTTGLRFGDGLSPDERRQGVLATFDRTLSSRLVLQLGVGALVGGDLRQAGVTYRADAGPAAAVALAYSVVGERPSDPFVILTGQTTASTATTDGGGERERLSAIDVRVGAVAGVPVADVLRPFAVARAFGGPIFWRWHGESRTGTDAYHYQLGLGASVAPGGGVDLFFESVLLGERGFSAGAGWRF
jgi:hypothetical protein